MMRRLNSVTIVKSENKVIVQNHELRTFIVEAAADLLLMGHISRKRSEVTMIEEYNVIINEEAPRGKLKILCSVQDRLDQLNFIVQIL